MVTRIEAADLGPRKLAAATERLCVATRTVRPVTELIRFVVGPDGEVVPDLKRKLPGRGAWVMDTRAALIEAMRRKVFARAFKREVRVDPDLPDRIEALLARSALDALSMAHKSGAVAVGFGQVETALQRQEVVALVHAAEAGRDGTAKIAAAARRGAGARAERIPLIALFGSAQLDLALGRANVIHAALLADRASDSFLQRCRSLERFRAGVPEGRRGAP
jgi:uncharacterized protein